MTSLGNELPDRHSNYYGSKEEEGQANFAHSNTEERVDVTSSGGEAVSLDSWNFGIPKLEPRILDAGPKSCYNVPADWYISRVKSGQGIRDRLTSNLFVSSSLPQVIVQMMQKAENVPEILIIFFLLILLYILLCILVRDPQLILFLSISLSLSMTIYIIFHSIP